MKYKIWYSGTDNAEDQDPEVLEFRSKKAAEDYAWEQAIEELRSYGGMHGYPDPDDDNFEEEAESWLDYKVEPVAESKLKKAAKEVKESITVKDFKKEGNYKEGDRVKIITDELAKGIKIEMEHTSDKKVAKQIVLDHLKEDPKYYTHLIAMEKKYKT